MKFKLLLVILTIIASFFRLYQLGDLPNSYTPDELAQGYTAYSILRTGQDEWGNSNFFSLKSFGDYKPSLQTIFMIPTIKLFGLTPFAVRLPNALFSILIIPLTFILAQKLFQNQFVSIISSLLVTFSPILLPMSRLALEANLVVVINLLAIIFYFKQKHSLSLLFFTLSLLTYHSAKIIFPLSLLLLFFSVRRHYRSLFLAVLIFVFIFLITSSNRTGDIVIFHPTDLWQSVAESRYTATTSGLPDLISRLFNNKLTYTASLFMTNYLSYLSPQFLTTSGAGETTYGMLPGWGIIGYVASLGLIISLINYLKTKNRQLLFLIILVLIAPIPAALSKGSYSANRLSLISPYLQILSAFGLYQIYASKHRLFKIVLLLFFIWETSSFMVTYFFRANQILSSGMLYGHRQAIDYLRQFPHHPIIYSRRLSEPQAYVAFFNQINPALTQQASIDWQRFETEKLTFLDQLGQYSLVNYTFKEINFASDSQIPQVILVGRPEEFPGITPTHIIHYPDPNHQIPAIYIYHSFQ